MKDISIAITGESLDFDQARAVAKALAERGNAEASLVAWLDGKAGRHSPCCVRCEIGNRPGWEVYGENHQGRVRIVINDREYVFIYT
ncbi:AF1514 family protein [Thiovibrio sp. JS02]